MISGGPPRARVFVSCGQSKETDEVQIAGGIRDRLRELGFDTYIAVAEQTLLGVRENIFKRLRESEYFLFVDFKREKLSGSRLHRGSLFSHQELAIASFHDIDVLAFQERGVKPTDGLLPFLQTNAIPFTDKHTLPNLVADIVQQRGWDSTWRNELALEASPPVDTDTFRAFHVSVRNRHREKLAVNCFAYLESAIKLPDTRMPLETIEFKWAATSLPSVSIAAGGTRLFDAFYIKREQPKNVLFQVHTDTIGYVPQLPREVGQYELSYLVRAENFPLYGSVSFWTCGIYSQTRPYDRRNERSPSASGMAVSRSSRGTFTASVECTTASDCNGPLAPTMTSLTFTVTNATLAQLENANAAGNLFVADIFCGATQPGSCLGLTGPVDVTATVPGPIVGAGLPGSARGLHWSYCPGATPSSARRLISTPAA